MNQLFVALDSEMSYNQLIMTSETTSSTLSEEDRDNG